MTGRERQQTLPGLDDDEGDVSAAHADVRGHGKPRPLRYSKLPDV